MKLQSRARQAFTLIEMLVVLTIIALLASITISAVFRLQSGQKESNTNTHLHKIDMMLMEQYKAAVAQIAKEDPPQVVKELTKNADGTYDIARAKALHMKLRLRQEFPQNFGEVNTGVTLDLTAGNVLISRYVYKGKQSYIAALKNPQTTGAAPNFTYPELSAEAQSGAMLVLILSQGRGGVAINPEQIAPTILLDYPQNNNAPNIQLRVFRDEWGNQIGFRRFADDDFTDVLAELNQKPFVSDTQIASGNMDPHDPDGRLKLQGWPQRATCLNYLANPNAGTRPMIQDPFDGRNRGPFAFSAGRDKQFYPPNLDDNLYSFRIQQTRRGN